MRLIKKKILDDISKEIDIIEHDVSREEEEKLGDEEREISYFDFYDESLITYGFPPHFSNDKEGFKQFIHLLWKAFPDIRITFEDVIIEGNKIAGRYVLEGTHRGEFLDLQPTNKQFKVNGMTVFYFQNSKCIKRWNIVDMPALMEQLKD